MHIEKEIKNESDGAHTVFKPFLENIADEIIILLIHISSH